MCSVLDEWKSYVRSYFSVARFNSERTFDELRRAAIAEEGPAGGGRGVRSRRAVGSTRRTPRAGTSDRGVLDRRRPRWDTPGFDASAVQGLCFRPAS